MEASDMSDEDSVEDSVSERSESEEEESKSSYEPRGRRGACSFIHHDKFYLFEGYTGGPVLAPSQSAFQTFDLHAVEWSVVHPTGERGEEQLPRTISGACCTVTNDRLYVFGGWVGGVRTADLHELNLNTMVWRRLDPKNPGEGPFLKDKAGIVPYGTQMVCVFGGYGYPSWDHIANGRVKGQTGASYDWDLDQPFAISWTNELHLFHVETRQWISPETTGYRPSPCAAFSLTLVDCHRAVLFGGRQRLERVNEVHILDMENWHWSSVIRPLSPEDPWPTKRSFHTACALVDPGCIIPKREKEASERQRRFEWLPCEPPDLSPPSGPVYRVDPKLLVLWGMDNNADPIHDAWEFNVNALTWKQVPLPPCVGGGRVWHTMASHHPSPCEAEVVVFGGSPENIFQRMEMLVSNVGATTVLCCGVASLYQLCLDHVTGSYGAYSGLLPYLPLPMQRDVERNCRRIGKLENFTTARL